MTRAREDKALEVWVGGGRELAGWLTTFKNVPMSMTDVLISIDMPDGADNWIQETRGFPLTPVKEDFDTDALIWKELKVDDKVPPYATRTLISNRDATRYTWRVLRISQEDFDWVFDHPDFVPADTPADHDAITTSEGVIADYLADELEDHMADAFTFGSASAYSGVFASATTSSNAAANSSAMTVETLQKAVELVRRAGTSRKSALT